MPQSIYKLQKKATLLACGLSFGNKRVYGIIEIAYNQISPSVGPQGDIGSERRFSGSAIMDPGSS